MSWNGGKSKVILLQRPFSCIFRIIGCTVTDSINTVVRMDIRKNVHLQNTVMNVYLPLVVGITTVSFISSEAKGPPGQLWRQIAHRAATWTQVKSECLGLVESSIEKHYKSRIYSSFNNDSDLSDDRTQQARCGQTRE